MWLYRRKGKKEPPAKTPTQARARSGPARAGVPTVTVAAQPIAINLASGSGERIARSLGRVHRLHKQLQKDDISEARQEKIRNKIEKHMIALRCRGIEIPDTEDELLDLYHRYLSGEAL